MISPRCIIDIQRLIQRVVALNKIISLIKEYCFPLFKSLKNIFNFKWTLEYQKVFEEQKYSLSSPKSLSQPQDGGDLFIYLRSNKLSNKYNIDIKKESSKANLLYHKSPS